MRNKAALLSLAVLCLFFAAASSYALASGPTGPRYTWGAFVHFWNKGIMEKFQIANPVSTKDGYVVEYGYTTTMQFTLDWGAVQSFCIHFVGGGENDAGGFAFRHLVDRAITVGTFRWPEENIEKVKSTFKVFSKDAKAYQYNATSFEYMYSPQTGWQFCTKFVPEREK